MIQKNLKSQPEKQGKVTLQVVMQQINVLKRAHENDNILLEERVKHGLFEMLGEYKNATKC